MEDDSSTYNINYGGGTQKYQFQSPISTGTAFMPKDVKGLPKLKTSILSPINKMRELTEPRTSMPSVQAL